MNKKKMQFPTQARDFRGRMSDALHHEAYEDHMRLAHKAEAAKS